jgi:hypothetical protein
MQPGVGVHRCAAAVNLSGEQVHINISAASEQHVAIDEMQHLCICRNDGSRHARRGAQHSLTLSKVAQSELSDDERVRENHSGIEQAGERLVASRARWSTQTEVDG